MRSSLHYVAAAVMMSVLLAPMPAFAALGTSFGGVVVAEIPCLSPLGPSAFITIKPAGLFPVSYIYTPATITKLDGPPVLGGQVVGIADVPFLCWNVTSGGLFGLFSVFSYLYGQRIQYIGTSPTTPLIGV